MTSKCMPEDHGAIFDEQKEYLQKELEPKKILPKLIENNLITSAERDYISGQYNRAMRVDKLVSILKTKNCFREFVDVLRKCDHHQVADKLSFVGKLNRDMQSLLNDIETMIGNEGDREKRARLLAIQSRTKEIKRGISEVLTTQEETYKKLLEAEKEISELKTRVKVLEEMNHKLDTHSSQLLKLQNDLKTKLDAEEMKNIKEDIIEQVLAKMKSLKTRPVHVDTAKTNTPAKTSSCQKPIDKGPVWKPQ